MPTEEVAKVWFGTQMVQEAEVKTLQQCRLLTELGLSMLVISDPLLAEVAKIKTLETLVLNTTPVSDAGIAHLQGHPALLSIRLGDTFVTTAGVRQLAQATPQLKGVTWSTVESEKMRQAIIGARNGGLMISRDVHSLRDLSTPGGPPPLNDPYRLFITRGWKPNEETREVFGVLGAPAPVSVNLNITDEAAWESLAFLPQIDELKIQLRKRASEATWSHLLEIKSLKRLSIPEGTPGAFLRQLSQVAGLQQLVVRKDALFFKDAPDIDALVQSGVKLERLELVGCNLTDKIITKIAAAKLTKEFVLRGCLGDSDEALQKARQLDPLLHIHRGDKPKKTTI
ncbi:hypothetical protein DSM3645_15525 [Blastopirellula marina DSM 3645]|uniref:Uncharacterized protein n=1 Tax=Blastopirellula marina DSM 3645 TaxID=314230 RepID=A3ZZ70_9BACT|nr:hypothetical protein DSM3645_15525 [Blastopirellula marina DSM 3645]